jgi:hypothetical protein
MGTGYDRLVREQSLAVAVPDGLTAQVPPGQRASGVVALTHRDSRPLTRHLALSSRSEPLAPPRVRGYRDQDACENLGTGVARRHGRR